MKNIDNHIEGQRLELSPAKRVFLERLMRGEGRREDPSSLIPKRTEQSPAPLSFAQQRLWFLDQLEPHNPAYTVPIAMRLKGRLNVAALEQSLNEIVRRHEVLRTTFSMVAGQPVQVIAASLNLHVTVVDVREFPEAARETEAGKIIAEEVQRRFDLSQDPLVRVHLLRLEEEVHILLIIMHHIVSDEWSMRIFFQELSILYKALVRGEPWSLPELPIQYADFAVWQRKWLRGDFLDTQRSYWREHVAGMPRVLELPTDRPRPVVQTYRGGHHSLVLSRNATHLLKRLSQQEGATLFMTLLSVFKTLLFHYTGQEDIFVGTPVANRSRTEIEGLIGFFTNTLVLRTDLSGNPTFRELMRRAREVCLGAYTHQDVPFEKLVEELKPERNLNYSPLFQVMFVFQDETAFVPELPGVRVSMMQVDSGTSKFDLTLFMQEEEGGLRATVEYSSDLFDAATIRRMLRHLEVLVEGIVTDPDRRLTELPLLTEVERHRLLVEWNKTQSDYPADVCVHQLFEVQAEQRPDGIAVVFEDQHLTYRELNARANQLAHYLKERGVGPDVPVGIFAGRSLDIVIGLLGILKAGGVYVPLDPCYPKDRLAFQLQDTCVPHLLTQKRLMPELPEHNVNVICLDSHWDIIAQEGIDNTVSGAQPENLIYILYTSGSTGRPKGVAIPHGSIVNLITWQLHQTDLPQGAKTLQYNSFSFDACFMDIFMSWCSGDTLFIVPEPVRQDITGLARFIADHGIERLNLPFIVLEHLATMWDAGEKPPQCMREIISTAEQLHVSQPLRRLFAQLPHCLLFNHYGPSETHVVTAFALTGPPGNWPEFPAIGRPIANTRTYILDISFCPVPVGLPGDLYIGGVSLARGYLDRPELTAERFVPNPFGDESEARIYKTGDVARYSPDGNIEYLGRMDHQVKLRGFRIELGEIEAVLNQHSGVKEAVVLAREGWAQEKRLVAYVVPNQTGALLSSELRGFLKQKLPEYMVPSVFVTLEALPLTSSGKVDRGALPVPGQRRPELEVTFAPPRTSVEEMLRGIWTEVLGLEQVGIRDNFFELGGHSLLAVKLVSRMSLALNREISVRFLFQHPTIADCSEAIENLHQAGESPQAQEYSGVSSLPHGGPSELSLSPFLQIEHRPLLPLFTEGKIPPVDAAALGYFPDSLLRRTDVTRDEIIDRWCDGHPSLKVHIETSLGRIALILLPRFHSELYKDEDDLVRVILEALELAVRTGASTVSLSGLIPSATDYGRSIEAARSKRVDVPMITTGHATTAATVVLAVKKILHEGGRDLARERVGFLGLGSIGQATLRLMLNCLPHPLEITLCDVYSKLDFLERIRRELIDDLGFQGPVRLSQSRLDVPPEFDEASLIVGATNVPDILDIRRVNPGTMMVDDSGPHCFVVRNAIRRLQEQEDILFTEGGVLRSPHPIRQLRYVPRSEEKMMDPAQREALMNFNPFHITGCVLSGLLSSRFEDLPPTVGLVDDQSCNAHYDRLSRLGFQGADLTCESYVLPEKSIHSFRNRFGGVDQDE
ncbi:MAG: amino acid adenylation domain-containing protein [Gemmatimonadota bacterium]|nr:MAG: amino acid adenylation domain-containing protein [Gemmatimonadota bacterium]